MFSNITGIILAGGKSNRMGTNKSLLRLNGKTTIERVVDLMKSIFKEVIIITNTPEEYSFINFPMFKDIYKNKGPLAGIHSGLTHSTTEQNFIISCDMPLMNSEMIKYIINFQTNKPISVCKTQGKLQTLAGRYSKSTLNDVEKLLFENNLNKKKETKKGNAVSSLLDVVKVEIINPENLAFYNSFLFFNMNRPEDYEKIVTLLKTNNI